MSKGQSILDLGNLTGYQPKTEKAKAALESENAAEHVDQVSQFFRKEVAGFIKAPLNRMVIFLCFFAWMAIALWQTTQIEATKEAEQFLDEDHPLQKSITILNNEFPTADDGKPV